MNYTHTVKPMRLSQHALGAQLPVPNGKLQIINNIGHLPIVTGKENKTKVLEDWIHTDKAQLSLHILNFDDATLVTITSLHTLLDVMGRNALLRAWAAVLDGREKDVPDFVGYDTDPLNELGKVRSEKSQDKNELREEKYILKDKKVRGLGMFRFLFNFIWELIKYPVEEGRMMIMPASFFEKLKAQAFQDLETLDPQLLTFTNDKHPTRPPSKLKPFLSDGDIISAWQTRLMATVNPSITTSSPARLISIMNLFGMRDLLRTSSPPYATLLPPARQGALINNCTTAIISLFTVQEFLTLPLGHIAARIRADIVKQGTRGQIEAQQRLMRESGSDLPLYGSGNMAMSVMTNWSKAKLFETDFSAAIVKEAREENVDGSDRTRFRGRPRHIHPSVTTAKGFMVRGGATCVGRDGQGDWWLGSLMRKECIPAFVRAVETMK
jgi:hypothetical protein